MWALVSLQSEPNLASLFRIKTLCSYEGQNFVSLLQYPPFENGIDGVAAFVRVTPVSEISESLFQLEQVVAFVGLHLYAVERVDAAGSSTSAGRKRKRINTDVIAEEQSAAETTMLLKFVPLL
eukprot:4829874-Pleurochrysis_carterae.AAC.1